jgi:hypothetical protein
MSASTTARRLLTAVSASCLLFPAGCGGPKIYPVSGVATLDGKPLEGFLVTFNPDTSKGTDGRMDCAGRLGSGGQYSIRMDDGFKQYKGMPLGFYKVTISSPDDKPIPVNRKYTSIKTTDLNMEVVSNPEPGRYDLKFTK